MILKMTLYRSSCIAKKRSWSGIRTKRRIFTLLEVVRFLRLFSDQLEELIQTMIHATIDGDTLAPKFDEKRYEKVRQVPHLKDEKNPYDFTVNYYKRKDLD